jgi:hypothetical protein
LARDILFREIERRIRDLDPDHAGIGGASGQ